MKVRYDGPYPQVDVPVLDRTVTRGEVVDVPDDLVLSGDWYVITGDKTPDEMTVPELRAALDAEGITAPGNARRADLLDLLTNSTPED